MKVSAPWIDNIINRLEHYSIGIDPDIKNQLKDIYLAMNCIKLEGDDDVRELWIEVPRGSIEDFGDFKEYQDEGLVETYKEFEREWKDYYPDKVKWYSFATAKYKEEMFFYINSRPAFTINVTNKPDNDGKYEDMDIQGFLDWLLNRIAEETSKIKQDVNGYNKYLDKNLSYNKRTGNIKRKKYWDILGSNAVRLDKRLGDDRIHTLRRLVEKQQNITEVTMISEMSADDYFRYCEICYEANDYFGKTGAGLSPKEKYRSMADGRCGGLTEIDMNSTEAFREWYHSGGKTGAHPWEICRGGNSTHISFMVAEKGNAWNLWLAGSSIVRVEETAKMAVALYESNIPFILHEGEEILNMITGNDYIGIVPDHVFPRYCHGLFPKDDRIIDFMHLGYENTDAIISNAHWYPLKSILLSP